MEKHVGDQ